MLITLNHLKSSLQAVKTYINNVLPKKVSDLVDDSGHYTKPSGGIPASDLADGVVPVEDVQVNGTSILSNGVANVPIATASKPGTVLVSGYGLQMQSNGNISTKTATSTEIKAGSRSWEHISPNNQHESTFYGLAKAAGDTTQSSSNNAVGNYTDSAKTAIKNMLGVPEDPLAVGTALPASADLNSYTTPGNYTADSTVMASVTNAPTVTVPYKLVIESIGDTAIEQTVITTDNQVYHRNGDLSGSNVAFGDWVKDVINTDCATDTTGKAIAEVIDDFTTCLATLAKRGDLFGDNKFIHGENDELILQYPSDNIEATVTLMTDTTGSLISQELQRMASIWEEAYNAN